MLMGAAACRCVFASFTQSRDATPDAPRVNHARIHVCREKARVYADVLSAFTADPLIGTLERILLNGSSPKCRLSAFSTEGLQESAAAAVVVSANSAGFLALTSSCTTLHKMAAKDVYERIPQCEEPGRRSVRFVFLYREWVFLMLSLSMCEEAKRFAFVCFDLGNECNVRPSSHRMRLALRHSARCEDVGPGAQGCAQCDTLFTLVPCP